MKRNALILLVTTCILAGCGHKTETTSETTTTMLPDSNATGTIDANVTTTNVTETAVAPQGFANAAAASDAFEIESSKLAATNASSAAVKKFAEQMIEAHTGSTAALKAAAAKLDPPVTPDPTLTADQVASLAALKTRQGKSFDAAYVDVQVAAHERALAMLKDYSASGSVAEFRTIATGLVPKVTAHLNMAKGMKL